MRTKQALVWLVPAAVLAVVAAVLGGTRGWLLVGVGPSTPAYLDLAQITYSADCDLPDAGEVGQRGCDPRNRPYNYPPVWAATARFLGIGADDTVWVGGLLAAIGIAALAVFFLRFAGRPTARRIATLTALTCSPPMLLMIARGNVDLLMLALLVAAACLVLAGRGIWAAAAIALAAGLKLFPIGALLALRLRPAVIGAALGAVAVLVLAGPWLGAIQDSTPSSAANSFGAGVLPAVIRDVDWSLVDPFTESPIVYDVATIPIGGVGVFPIHQAGGVALFAVLFGLLFLTPAGRRVVASATTPLRADRTGTIAFLVGAGPFLVTYLLTTSFDYRLAPLIFVGVACLRTDSRALRTLTLALVVVLWARLTRTSAQFIGDVVLVAVTPYIAAVATVLILERWGIHPRRRRTPADTADTAGRPARTEQA